MTTGNRAMDTCTQWQGPAGPTGGIGTSSVACTRPASWVRCSPWGRPEKGCSGLQIRMNTCSQQIPLHQQEPIKTQQTELPLVSKCIFNTSQNVLTQEHIQLRVNVKAPVKGREDGLSKESDTRSLKGPLSTIKMWLLHGPNSTWVVLKFWVPTSYWDWKTMMAAW